MPLRKCFWVLGVTALVAGCGGGGAETPPPPSPVLERLVPAGVDSTTAMEVDSIADASFVTEAQEGQALELREEARLIVERTDSMWIVMSALIDAQDAVSEPDSLQARDAATEGGVALVQLDSLIRTSDLDQEALARESAVLLGSAEVSLERSFRMNPFDTRSRVWLAQVYELQARRLGRSEQYQSAIDELEKLALLTPDQHSVYAMLANNYFYVNNWDGAALNYEKAEEIYLQTYDLVIDDPQPLDSAMVYAYVQAQADMHLQRLDASRASTGYERALLFAPTAEDSAYVNGELEWMAWDDQNLRSAFTRDSLLTLEQGGDMDSARRGYAALIPTLSAQSAIDETDWRLGIVDYNLGNDVDAANRLQALIERAPTGPDGVPSADGYQRYFDDFGTLLVNLGRRFRVEQRDRRTSLKYFTQATTFPWSGRAVAYFESARLVQGNVEAGLESANLALAEETSLNDQQRGDLYRLLVELHRRMGDFDAARRYRDAYRALRGG